jgi:hypothetical protein
MNKKAVDLSHLTPAAQAAAMLPNEERVWRIRADRWIGYGRARTALHRLDDLFNWPSKQRMPNMLIIGPTNNGKSMIIEKFRREHTRVSPKAGDQEIIPVVVVQTPSEPSVARFYAMLLASIGAPLHPRAKVAELEHLTLKLLRAVKTKMLVIDELHNILAGKSDVRREFLNLMRFLGNELRIPIVGVGIRDAFLAIRSDDQLENRFEPFTVPVWQEGDELLSLLASFAKVLPLRRASQITSDDVVRYILSRTEGTIGEITRLLTAAAIMALETGEECVTRRTLSMCQYESPTERRKSFERTLL